MDLGILLAECRRASQLRKGYAGPAFEVLREALADDDALATAARAMIVTDDRTERDHLSRWTNDLLQRALERPDV